MQLADYGSNDYVPIISGPAKVAYTVDFYPILKQTGMIGEDYIKQLNGHLEAEEMRQLEESAIKDKRNTELDKILPLEKLEKDVLVEGYYIDFCVAQELGVSVAFDRRIERFIAAKNHQMILQFMPDVSSLVFNKALNLQMPDFRKQPWKKIHEIRQSAAGQSFRDMIQQIQLNVAEAMPSISIELDLQEVVNRSFSQELFDEMKEFLPTGGTTTIGVMCSVASIFIPPAGFVGNVNDVQNLIKLNQSWVSLLKR